MDETPGPGSGGPASVASTLGDVLGVARARGYIGGPDLDVHIRQAEAFVEVVGAVPVAALDLGSGGGLPGLVLAASWPGCRVTLLDGSSERAAFLREAARRLCPPDRVAVAEGRAEVLGHDPRLRGSFEVAVARAFGPPAVVAECGAPFLAAGGRLVVSEPPGSNGSRWWHPEELAQLGLQLEDLRVASGHRFQVLRAAQRCPSRYPRRTGVPAKRPLFRSS